MTENKEAKRKKMIPAKPGDGVKMALMIRKISLIIDETHLDFPDMPPLNFGMTTLINMIGAAVISNVDPKDYDRITDDICVGIRDYIAIAASEKDSSSDE